MSLWREVRAVLAWLALWAGSVGTGGLMPITQDNELRVCQRQPVRVIQLLGLLPDLDRCGWHDVAWRRLDDAGTPGGNAWSPLGQWGDVPIVLKEGLIDAEG